KNVEYDLHTDTSGYWGVAAPADPLPTVQLGASPAALGFGNTVIGLSRPETVPITNSGTAAASGVTMAISGPNANAFALSENDCSSGVLAPQSTCSVTIAFTPATIGNHTASLIVMGGAMDITVALTGVGTAAPTVVLSP